MDNTAEPLDNNSSSKHGMPHVPSVYLYGEQPLLPSRGFQDLCVAACDRPPSGPRPSRGLEHRGCPVLLRQPPLFLVPLVPERDHPLPRRVHPEHALRVLCCGSRRPSIDGRGAGKKDAVLQSVDGGVR